MSETTDDDDTQGHKFAASDAPGAVEAETYDDDDEDDTQGHVKNRLDEAPGFSGAIKPDTTTQS